MIKRGTPQDEPGEARRSQEAPNFPEERQKRSPEAPGSSLAALITPSGPNDTAPSRRLTLLPRGPPGGRPMGTFLLLETDKHQLSLGGSGGSKTILGTIPGVSEASGSPSGGYELLLRSVKQRIRNSPHKKPEKKPKHQ